MYTFPSSKMAVEVVYLSFDFTQRLQVGETITSASFSNISINGTDNNAALMLCGLSAISGNVVSQLVQGGIAGNTYELSNIINTSGGRILAAQGIFRVV